MKTFTKTVTEKNMSINDIAEELRLHISLVERGTTSEDVLLATVQELASAVIAIKEELKFNRF